MSYHQTNWAYKSKLRSCIGYLCGILLMFAITGCTPAEQAVEVQAKFSYSSYYARVNGTQLHYLKAGNDNSDQVMVLLHGFPHVAEVWHPLIDHFAKQYTVVVPDLRGYGRSNVSEQPSDYAIANLVEDIHQLVQHVSPEQQIVLVGHDWGGVLAWGLAQTQPQLIEQLVVINAPQYNAFLHTLRTSEAQREASKYITRLDSWWLKLLFWWQGPELLWRGLAPSYEAGKVAEAYKQVFFASWQNQTSVEAAITYYSQNFTAFDSISDTDFWPDKDSVVDVSSLLIWSSHDKAFTPDALAMTQQHAAALTTYEIDTESHTPFISHSEEVIEVIDNFLNQH